jgi:hypothetical protein
MKLPLTFAIVAFTLRLGAAEAPLVFNDPNPQRYDFSARASEIDPRAKEHPEIEFVFNKDGKPQDVEQGTVDTRVKPRGELMIWLMSGGGPLFERVNSYGIHAVRVHYANGWFGKFGKDPAPGDATVDTQALGKIRLEAATGEDFSKLVEIPKPDGIMERAHQLVKHMAKVNPQGRWDYFLTPDGLRWDHVIIAGISHGATTAARFAIHQKVARVVMFSGPRDQYETWQSLPSATPANRYFGFSHTLDTGWSGGHYCRSWELLGLHRFGPLVDVDTEPAPFGNSRRLITSADVKGNAGRAHSSSMPGGAAVKDADGKFIHEAVWRYLFTQPVETAGAPVPPDPKCLKDLHPAPKKTAAVPL